MSCIFIRHMSVTMMNILPLGRDVIGLAETGSGKTGYILRTLIFMPDIVLTYHHHIMSIILIFFYRAFSLPMLHSLLSNPQRLFGLILTPTRELAFQISEQIEALGRNIHFSCHTF